MKSSDTTITTPDHDLIPLALAAKSLGVAYITAWSWAKSGRLPTVQMLSRRRFVKRDVLEAMIAGKTGEAHE